MSNEMKIPEEAAEKQVDILVDFYHIDREKELPKQAIPDLTRHIMFGLCTIELDDDAKLKIHQHFKYPMNDFEGVTYKVIRSENKKQMKIAAKSHAEQLCALMGSLSGGGGIAMARLEGVDMSCMESIGNMLLSV